jgi:hypothetical protein
VQSSARWSEFSGSFVDLRREVIPKPRGVTQLIFRVANPSINQLPNDVCMASVLRRLSEHPHQQHTQSRRRFRPPRNLSGSVELQLIDRCIGMRTSRR